VLSADAGLLVNYLLFLLQQYSSHQQEAFTVSQLQYHNNQLFKHNSHLVSINYCWRQKNSLSNFILYQEIEKEEEKKQN